jgi:hypothetical protein
MLQYTAEGGVTVNSLLITVILLTGVIIMLAVRATMRSQTPAAKESTVWHQRLVHRFAIFGLLIIGTGFAVPILSMPWTTIAALGTWLGFSVATVPGEITWPRTISYTLQLIVTAALMFAAIIWLNSSV